MRNRQVEAEQKIPKGTIVQVDQSRLNDWRADVAAKLKNRLGRVTSYTYPSGEFVVTFEAIGRRTEFRKSFSLDHSGLIVVTDAALIEKYAADVAKRKATT